MMPDKEEKFDALLYEVASRCDLEERIPGHRPEGLDETQQLEAVEAQLQEKIPPTLLKALDRCPHCRDVVQLSADALRGWKPQARAAQEESVDQSVTEADIQEQFRAVFGWLKDSIQFLHGTAKPRPLHADPVSVRSSSAALASVDAPCFSEFRTHLGGNLMRVQVERLPAGSLDIHIKVEKKAQGNTPKRATLLSQGRVVESVPLEDNRVHFKELAPARYVVKLTCGSSLVGSVDLVFMHDDV